MILKQIIELQVKFGSSATTVQNEPTISALGRETKKILYVTFL